MPWLTLNGITAPVTADQGGAVWTRQADEGRALDGSQIGTTFARKRRWEVGLKPLARATAVAWVRLAQGLGHRWSFVDKYSSKGLAAVETGTVTFNGASGKFDKKVTIAAASSAAWTLGTDRHDGLVADYTVSVWKWSGSAWVHYLVVVAGGAAAKKWVGGVRNDAASTSWLTVDLALGKVTLGEGEFSEMVAHPFAVPDAWESSFSGATVAHPDLPALRAGGTAVAENAATTATVTVELEGEPKTSERGFMNAGAWELGQVVEFVLVEV